MIQKGERHSKSIWGVGRHWNFELDIFYDWEGGLSKRRDVNGVFLSFWGV